MAAIHTHTHALTHLLTHTYTHTPPLFYKPRTLKSSTQRNTKLGYIQRYKHKVIVCVCVAEVIPSEINKNTKNDQISPFIFL